jgi:hypothetical protein
MPNIDRDERDAFKAYAIERSRDPSEMPNARDRARMACIVIPASIQKWMLEAGAVEPLLDSIEATILAAEQHAARHGWQPDQPGISATIKLIGALDHVQN